MIQAFVPRTPITYDENEGEINRVRGELRDAMARRDYQAAEQWQREVEYTLKVRDYLLRQANRRDKFAELNRLEMQRQKEEEELKSRLNEQMERTLASYQQRLDEMERRHADELARLDRKFSDPRYGALRESPTLNCLLKSEQFYSAQLNYKVALAFKERVVARTDDEIDAADATANAQVQAKVALLVRKHELEKKGFRDRLEAEKNRLNREAANALIVLRNKYGKLRRRELAVDDFDPLPESTRREGRGVYRGLQIGFSTVLGAAEKLTYVCEEGPASARTVPTARNARVRRALQVSLSERQETPK
jgi:hypothetical protein